MTTGTADKFLGAELWALVPISIMSAPNGKFLRDVRANNYVGTIYSYVLHNGNVWWQIDNKDKKPIGYVQHGEDKFNKEILKNSLAELKATEEKELQEAIEKRKKENPSGMFGFLEDFESIFKYVMILIILLLILNVTRK